MAKKIKFVQTNFTAGELDPRMKARIDDPSYEGGCLKLRNAVLTSQGSAFRRPGTLFVDSLSASNVDEVRLESFIFSETQEYLFCFEVGKLTVYEINNTTGATTKVGSSVTTYTLGSSTPTLPITSSNIREFTFAQQGDTFIICHNTFTPIIIQRASATSFTAKALTFKVSSNNEETYQPYTKLADSDVTILPSSNIGSITLTASESIFTTEWEGESIQWHGKEILLGTYDNTSNGTVISGTVKDRLEIELGLNPFRSISGTNTVEITLVNHGFAAGDKISLEGFAGEPGLINRSGLNGTFQIGRIVNDDAFMIQSTTTTNQTVSPFGFFFTGSYTAAGGFAVGSGAISGWATYNTDNEVAGYTGTSANTNPNGNGSRDFGGASIKITGADLPPSRSWKEQAFGTRNKFPRAITFHQNRLWFGGTTSQPDALFASQSGDYFNFDVGTGAANDSIQTILASDQLNEINHIVYNKGLSIFTSGGEFVVLQEAGTPLTPTNIQIERITSYGSTRVSPYMCNGNTFFVQRNGRTIRAVETSGQNAFVPADISIRSSHLINNPIDSSSFNGSNTRPEEFIYYVNADGTVGVFHTVISESIASWVLWDNTDQTPGQNGYLKGVKSISSVNEHLFWVTQREGLGTQIEKFTNFDESDITKENYLDDAVAVTVASNQTISGIPSHWHNRTVHVIKDDGSYRGTQTVSATGTLDPVALNLKYETSEVFDRAYIGYSYFLNIETMPVDYAYTGGSLTGGRRRIARVNVETEGSLSMSVNGKELFNRTTETGLIQQDPKRVTGRQDFRVLGYSKDPTIVIKQTLPNSCGVLQLSSEVTI